LPSKLTSLVGRREAIAELGGRLTNARLLTLTGPGGVGKTRLALALAEAVASAYEDGVWLVELAAVVDPALIASAVAAGLGVSESGGLVSDQLVAALRSKAMLLVLDNCEHVVRGCAELADALLLACPDLQILATSRELLRIDGEFVWPVPPLRLPEVPLSAEKLAQVQAVQLFVERAAATQPGFRLTEHNAASVTAVCRTLDGIPLAIELAAARLSLLSVEQLAARMCDLSQQMNHAEIACMFLEGALHLAAVSGKPDAALRLAGAAAAYREATGSTLFPVMTKLTDSWLAPARSALGRTRSRTLFGNGAKLSSQQAVREASTCVLTGWHSSKSSHVRLRSANSRWQR
jgi:predicted ATPase